MKFTYDKKLSSGKPYLVQKSKGEYLFNDGKGNERDISTVIAQFEMVIRKDERQKVLAEVEGWLVDEEVSPIRLTAEAAEIAGKVQSSAEGRNQYRAELRAKLVEMKGTNAN